MSNIEPPWDKLSVPRELAATFLVVFARFEFALKSDARFRCNGPDARADFDRFARELADRFKSDATPELASAVKFLLSAPPRKQIVRDRNLDWTDGDPGGTELHRLQVYVCRVRNNLFHGAKFIPPESNDSDRDERLVRAALEVLSAFVELDGNLHSAFSDWWPRDGH